MKTLSLLVLLAMLTVSCNTAGDSGKSGFCPAPETWEGISVPSQLQFDNDFANGDEWSDPRRKNPDLGNRRWSQFIFEEGNTLQQITAYDVVGTIVSERSNDLSIRSFYLEIAIVKGITPSVIAISAPLNNTDWPTKQNRFLDKLNIGGATYFVMPKGGDTISLPVKEGTLTQLVVSQDGLWISGKFELELEPNVESDVIYLPDIKRRYKGRFRGGLFVDCILEQEGQCEQQYIIDNVDYSVDWIKRIGPTCIDQYEVLSDGSLRPVIN